MNNVIVIPTWRCGLSCPYCAYEQQDDCKSIKYLGADYLYKVEKELIPEEWVSLLQKYEPALFDFSGGEPLRYEGIEKVLNSLSRWSITSNTLLLDLDTSKIDFSKCAWWTASYHPHVANENLFDVFVKNIIRIKKNGVGVGVTLVAKPDTLSRVLSLCSKFAGLGFRVNIHPYYDDASFSWKKHPKEVEILKKSPFLRYDDRLFSYAGISGSGACRGGKSLFAIGPDGKIFKCLTNMLFGREPISENQTLLCNEKCYFPCDWYYGGRG